VVSFVPREDLSLRLLARIWSLRLLRRDGPLPLLRSNEIPDATHSNRWIGEHRTAYIRVRRTHDRAHVLTE